MLVEIRLVNIKSYSDQKIRFFPGLNAIIGENGAGKTTIIEAIGFVLFNTLPYKISDFLRRGEKRGEIRLKIVANDDRVYTIVRKISASGTLEYYVNDEEFGRVAEGISEVTEWVKENFNLEIDPSNFFENVIGVAQGKITSHFLEPPAIRDRVFSPILGVEGYKKAFDKSREYENFINNKIYELDKKIAVLKRDVEHKKSLEEKINHLIKEKEEIEKNLSEIEVESIAKEVEKFDEISSSLKSLEAEKKQKKSEKEDIDKEINRIEKELNDIRKAEIEMKKLETSYSEYINAEKEVSKLEPVKSELEEKSSTLAELSIRHEKIKLEIDIKKKELDEIGKKEEEVERIKPLAEKEKKLTDELNQILTYEESLKNFKKQFESLENEIKNKEESLRKIGESEEKLRKLKVKLEKIKPVVEKKDKLVSYRAGLVTKLKMEKQQYEKLKNNICPVLREECDKIYAARDSKKKEIDEIESKLKEIDEKYGKIEKLFEEYRKIEAEINRLNGEVKSRRDIENEVAEKKGVYNEIRNRILELSEIVGKKESLEKELDTVKGCTDKLTGLRSQILKKEILKEDLKKLESEEEKILKELTKLDEVNEKLKEIKRRIDELVKIRNKNSESFKRYIQLKEKVSRLGYVEDRYKELKEKTKALKGELDRIDSQIEKLSAVYSSEKHIKLKEKLKELIMKKGELEGKIQKIKDAIADVEKELKLIGEKEEELNEVEKQKKIFEKKYRFIKNLREIFRLAVPGITRAYTETVSSYANSIFCEMMDDYGWELYWTEDFGIKAKYAGREIDFAQMSGGEQMCAALAVRLALLKLLSGIDIALFDEPTQNMDEFRRRNLAYQLSKIEGFRQIIVISHDATFEEMVESAIKVRKNGVSIVEQ